MFGMGTGGSSLLSPPDFFGVIPSKLNNLTLTSLLILYALPEPLCVRSVCTLFNSTLCLLFCRKLCSAKLLWSSPRTISTGQLHTLLHFHLRPINQIVFLGPYSIKDERSHLRGSFTLRCFQRLSRPHLATLLCRWHDNRCTRGASIPVLSY